MAAREGTHCSLKAGKMNVARRFKREVKEEAWKACLVGRPECAPMLMCWDIHEIGQQSVAGDCFATANHELSIDRLCNQMAVVRMGLKDVNGDQKKVSR